MKRKVSAKAILIVVLWIILGVALVLLVERRNAKEREGWTDEQWRQYYDAIEKRSFRGE